MKKVFPLFLFLGFMPLTAAQMVDTTALSSGDTHCPAGGTAVLTGEDTNSDGKLEEGVDTISSVAYVCNGENGCNAVVKTEYKNSLNTECPTTKSGVVVTSGPDCDKDGTIDDNAETVKTTLCHGADGTNGTNGSATIEGGSADDGADGADGKPSEVIISEEPAGENCAVGGTKVENRSDKNGNGTFEESEITVKYVCNGADGQSDQGEPGKTENNGTDGKNGTAGSKGDRGDQGSQGEQGPTGEKGETGPDGYDSLTSIVDEPAGDKCENGGQKFMSGIDSDRNGILDENEVKNSYYICNGEDAVEASEQVASSGCSVTTI